MNPGLGCPDVANPRTISEIRREKRRAHPGREEFESKTESDHVKQRGFLMEEIQIRVCSDEDLDLLAVLNNQLIEDEQHDNKMNVEQLRERMNGFINTDYKAYLFEKGSKVIGYALVNHTRKPLYLRQFFICRDVRRQGYGKTTFNKLLELLKTEIIDIEVMSWNGRGIGFWRSLGFKDRSIYMRFDKNPEKIR